MRRLSLAAFSALLLLAAAPAGAQGTSPGGAVVGGKAAEQPTTSEKPARRSRSARTNREPTAGQMAARERQRKCGAEWKDAKAGGKTGGLKWPQFYSRCNARLKGNSA